MARATLAELRDKTYGVARGLTELLAPLITGLNYDGTQYSLPVADRGSGEQVYDGTVVFANSAAANTQVSTAEIPLPSTLQGDARYVVTILNPSTVTALTVRPENRETFAGTARYADLPTFTVPVSSPEGVSRVVEGFLVGEAGRLTLSNDTVLGVAGGFTANIRVRRV